MPNFDIHLNNFLTFCGVKQNQQYFSIIIQKLACCGLSTRFEEALFYHTLMLDLGVKSDKEILLNIVKAAKGQQFNDREVRTNALAFLTALLNQHYGKWDTQLYNALIDVEGSVGNIQNALKLLEEMPKTGCPRDADSFNILLSWCKTRKHFPIATQIFRDMINSGFFPDRQTLKALMQSIADSGALDFANMVLKRDPTSVTHNSLIRNLLMKCQLKARQYELAFKTLMDTSNYDLKLTPITFKIFLSHFADRSSYNDQWSLKIFDAMSFFEIKYEYWAFEKVIRAHLLSGNIVSAKQSLLECIERYRCQNQPLPNDLSLSFIEILQAYSQTTSHFNHLQYKSLYGLAVLYFGDNQAHEKWLRKLKVRPDKRIGKRRDRMGIRAVRDADCV